MSGDGAESRPAGAAGLDGDTVDQILARLVSSGTAAQLSRCACVCTLWAAASMDDALWRVLLLRRCGDGAEAMLEALESAQRAAKEPAASCRALYIRSVTTRVLLWGHCDSDPPYTLSPWTWGTRCAPALFGPLSESREASRVVRQASAGVGFVCAVTWGGTVLCWGVNRNRQCGVEPVEPRLPVYDWDPDILPEDLEALEPEYFVEQPHRLALPLAHAYAVQVSCGARHAACVVSGGAVFCWGDNRMRQLGNAQDDANFSATGSATPVHTALPDGAGATRTHARKHTHTHTHTHTQW